MAPKSNKPHRKIVRSALYSTDAVEDPTLEPKKRKNSSKIQRRPLVLKESESDQNPSATNEEENKRQSKKYSASIKQIELDDLVKKVQEESSTERLTTVEGKG